MNSRWMAPVAVVSTLLCAIAQLVRVES